MRVVFDLNDINYQYIKTIQHFRMFSQVQFVNDIQVTQESNATLVEITANGEIGYELVADKNKKQLTVLMPGVCIEENLLNKDIIRMSDDVVENIELVKEKGDKNYNFKIIINLNTFTSYEMLSSPPSSLIKLKIHKSPLTNKLIAVDPGHGGIEPGAVVNGIKEKDLNLDIALKLRSLLEANGAKVFIIRDEDIFVSHFVRAGMANEINADLPSYPQSASSGIGTETTFRTEKNFATVLQRL